MNCLITLKKGSSFNFSYVFRGIVFVLFIQLTLSVQAQTFSWAKQFNLGATSFYNRRSGMDGAGNYYVAGTNFVLKLSPAGTTIWTRQFVNSTISISGVAIDASGNVFLTGSFTASCNFNPWGSGFPLNSFGSRDAFIEKLDANGNFLWAAQVGGIGTDQANSICLDGSGNVYITGNFGYTGNNPPSSADFDPGANQYILQSNGRYDLFVEKLDTNGSFVWASSSGGTQDDSGGQLASDVSNNVFLWGNLNGATILNKLDVNGNSIWTKQLLAPGACCLSITDVFIDASGNLLSTGYFSGTVDFDPGAGVYNVTGPDGQDGFIWKLDNSGNFVWAKAIIGGFSNPCDGICSDAYGNVYTAGMFSGNGNHDFDPGPDTYNLQCGTSADLFILKLNASGNFVWAIQVGGGNNTSSIGYGIQVGSSSEIYSSVNFSGLVDFDPGKAKFNLSSSNGSFVVHKMIQAGGGNVAVPNQIVSETSTDRLKIYPNPNNGSFYIDVPAIGEKASLIIYDIIGRRVQQRDINGSMSQKMRVDLNKGSKGIYLVELKTSSLIYRSKINVQ